MSCAAHAFYGDEGLCRGCGRTSEAIQEEIRQHVPRSARVDPTPLTIELVPSTVWYSNVRSLVSRKEWEICKRVTSEAAGRRCQICGGRGRRWPVECHEVWSYDEHTFIQKLERLIALCPSCHEVKHFGRTAAIGNYDRAFAHLRRVNGWTDSDAAAYLEVQYEVWSLRSMFKWEIDLSFLASIGIAVPALPVR